MVMEMIPAETYGILHIPSGELVYFATDMGEAHDNVAWIPNVITSIRYNYTVTTIAEVAALLELDESEFTYLALDPNKDIIKTLILED